MPSPLSVKFTPAGSCPLNTTLPADPPLEYTIGVMGVIIQTVWSGSPLSSVKVASGLTVMVPESDGFTQSAPVVVTVNG